MDADELAGLGALPWLAKAGTPTQRSKQSLELRIEQVMMAAPQVLGVDGVGFMLQDEAERLYVIGTTGRGAALLEDAQIELHLGPGLDSFLRSATVPVTDLAHDPDYGALWHRASESGARAILSVPFKVHGSAVGNLDAWLRYPHEWPADEARAIEAYAGILGFTLGLAAQATYWGDLSGSLSAWLELIAGGDDPWTDPEGYEDDHRPAGPDGELAPTCRAGGPGQRRRPGADRTDRGLR